MSDNSDKRGRFAPYVLGSSLLVLGATAALFATGAAVFGEPLTGFMVCALVALPVGFGLRFMGRAGAEPSRREAIATVLLLWSLLPIGAAIPFTVAGPLSPLNALFEAMSGFTTTGGSVIADLSAVSNTLLLWRALSQWVGGVGILVLFVAVFPQLAIAGRQLFFAEAPGANDDLRLLPRLQTTALAVISVYSATTLACAAAYTLFGMTPFEAVAHALSTVSAGGFSTRAEGFMAFDNAGLEWVAICFMFLAGVSFALLYRAFSGRPRSLLRDPEFRLYSVISVSAGLVIAAVLASQSGLAPLDAVRHGLFNALSVMTSTGYATDDFGAWIPSAQSVLVMLMFIGGSTGSAGGGVKVGRWLIIAKIAIREVRHALHPRAVLPITLGKRPVSDAVLRSVSGFITLYIGLFAMLTMALVFSGHSFITSFSAAAAAIGNGGVGLDQVGPLGSFASLEPFARGLLIFGMYAGRLEVITVFVIFVPSWWQRPRRR
ncbi:MAG: TrkH family potassium uptake protein [Trueperaceae bacterium]|nr:TrkH family potassium uptake protein [Trueperaceae bacterium]